MKQPVIHYYQEFVDALIQAGFSMGGGKSEGIYALIPWGWNEVPPYETLVKWHTGDREHDPWEWRMRVLDERKDIAYGKFFLQKSGYITREWAPAFIAVRRGVKSFQEAYLAGTMSQAAKRIYDVMPKEGALPLHAMKQLAGFTKEEKSKFDRGLTELQMKMYLSMCGRQQKRSQRGEAYGWSSTVFCRTEDFWEEEVFKEAALLSQQEGIDKIKNKIALLNPEAKKAKVLKFVNG